MNCTLSFLKKLTKLFFRFRVVEAVVFLLAVLFFLFAISDLTNFLAKVIKNERSCKERKIYEF